MKSRQSLLDRLCEGGELLERILSRGGRYSEEDAKAIVIQILSVIAFCHLQGVVHRDLKPENFLFTTRDENAQMKLIDFVKPGILQIFAVIE
ncbi:CDPK-related protein kinase-like [Zingiber officinale]|uniref:CDPK-related protein kinase-like n=1 Tax=Zingiber officinale TaxID=94328 RepID=UPI001C4A8440|nr:CDPK-related protein kinase-like [Zingiber officinale]